MTQAPRDRWQAVPLRAATVVDAPLTEIRHALTGVDLWRRAAAAEGYRLRVDDDPTVWDVGQRVRLDTTTRKIRPVGRHRAEISIDEHGLPVFRVTRGPAAGGRLTVALDATPAGVLVTVEFANPARGGGVADRLRAAVQSRHRVGIVRALRTLTGMVVLHAHQTSLVVAGAIVRDHAVLAARRTYPPAAAGRWEFPGGKVGVGETPERALVRELAEELGVDAAVGKRLGPEISLDVELVLRLYAVTVAGEPQLSTEHDELRWLRADELDSVDWLVADQRLLPAVAELLRSGGRN